MPSNGLSVAAVRTRLIGGHAPQLSDVELLSALLGGPAAATVQGWADRYACDGSPWLLDEVDVRSIDGLAGAARARMLASGEIIRRRQGAVGAARPLLSSPESVISYCGPAMAPFDREHFWVLALDPKNRLIRQGEVSVGIVDATVVHPREVYKDAVRLSATGIVVVHNHPSGDPQPSRADLRLTRRLAEAGEVMGIQLLDHVIIGSSGIGYSMREHGELG